MKVVAPKQMPTGLPILTTVVLWLVLDRLRPAEWIWVTALILTTVYWCISIFLIFNEDHTNIWED